MVVFHPFTSDSIMAFGAQTETDSTPMTHTHLVTIRQVLEVTYYPLEVIYYLSNGTAAFDLLLCGQSCLIIRNIYRPPGPATAFFSELQDILSYISTLPHDLALMGDFNLRIDSSSSDAGRLSGILDSFNLHQYVDFPIYIQGHSLDLMICSPGCNVLSVSASDLISDHFSVVANLQIPSNHSRTIPQTIKYRKLQSINIEAFKADIQHSDLIRYPKTNATELALQYDSVLHTPINLHAPLVTKKISIKPPSPWMTPAILAFKQYRRYLEGIWRSNPTALNRSNLLGRHISAIDRCQRQNRLTIPKLLLSILAIMGHYGRHSTKSYIVALKYIFLIILLLPLWPTLSARFSLTKSLPFALPSPLTHTLLC